MAGNTLDRGNVCWKIATKCNLKHDKIMHFIIGHQPSMVIAIFAYKNFIILNNLKRLFLPFLSLFRQTKKAIFVHFFLSILKNQNKAT